MPDPAPPSSEQAEARSKLAEIRNNPQHPYNVAGHRDYPVAEAEVLALSRAALADENEVRALYHEPGDTGVLPALPPPRPTATWDDFKQLAPSEMAPPDVTRFQAVATGLGATVYEGVRLLNLTRSALPAEEDAPDFSEYWGADWRAKAERVGTLMREIKAKAPDFYERLAPHLARRTDVADHVLTVAERLAGVPASPRPSSRPSARAPEAEPVDRAAAQYPFRWVDESRR